MANVYKQGIGKVAYKLQDGGEVRGVDLLSYDPSLGYAYGASPEEISRANPLSQVALSLSNVFDPRRRPVLTPEEVIETPGLRQSDDPRTFIDAEGNVVRAPRAFDPETGIRSYFIQDPETGVGTLREVVPPVYGKAEESFANTGIARGVLGAGKYFGELLNPETRLEALKSAGRLVVGAGESLQNQMDAIGVAGRLNMGRSPRSRVEGIDVDGQITMANPELFTAGVAAGGYGLSRFIPNSTGPGSGFVAGSFIGERGLSRIDNRTKVSFEENGATIADVKDSLIVAKKAESEINNLTIAEARERMGTVHGLKALEEIPDSEVFKILHELEVRQKTGWARPEDGLWRYEISDSTGKFDPQTVNKLKEGETVEIGALFKVGPSALDLDTAKRLKITPDEYVKGTSRETGKNSLPLLEIYPDSGLGTFPTSLSEIKVKYDPEGSGLDGATAQFDPSKNTITTTIDPDKYPETARTVILHEVTHGNQENLGLSLGADSGIAEQFSKRLKKLERDLVAFDKALTTNPNPGLVRDRNRLSLEIDQLKEVLYSYDKIPETLKTLKSNAAYSIYHKLLGEIEARLVERRATLNTKELRTLSPYIDMTKVIRNSLYNRGFEVEINDKPNAVVTRIGGNPQGVNSIIPDDVQELADQLKKLDLAEFEATRREFPKGMVDENIEKWEGLHKADAFKRPERTDVMGEGLRDGLRYRRSNLEYSQDVDSRETVIPIPFRPRSSSSVPRETQPPVFSTGIPTVLPRVR